MERAEHRPIEGIESTRRTEPAERTRRPALSAEVANPAPTGAAVPAHPIFGELLILAVTPAPDSHAPVPSIACTEDVTRAARGALLRHATDPPPALLSGHAADGSRLERPHTGFLALPDLGARAAEARIAGVAIALPRDVDADSHQAILLAAARWERSGLRLLLGRLGVLRLARASGSERAAEHALDAGTWTRASRRWASVTPVALPRNPGDLTSRDRLTTAKAIGRAQEIVADACEQVGLPRPARVRISPRSAFPPAPPASAFMPYPRLGSGFKRVCVHVEVEWEKAVAGPVVIGVGRYFGVGSLAPRRESQ